jgi:hypothetical protein
MTYQHDKIPTSWPHTYYLLPNLISTINYHGYFEIFTNPPNPTSHLMLSSLKIIKGK